MIRHEGVGGQVTYLKLSGMVRCEEVGGQVRYKEVGGQVWGGEREVTARSNGDTAGKKSRNNIEWPL